MEIIEYTLKYGTKDRLLQNALSQVKLPVAVKKVYMEELGETYFMANNLIDLPILEFIEGEKKIRLQGNISPDQIKKVIESLK